jgi:hypothetical protein
MPSAITPLLTNFGLILAELLDVFGAIAGYLITNPLFIVAVALTVIGLGVKFVRGFVHH